MTISKHFLMTLDWFFNRLIENWGNMSNETSERRREKINYQVICSFIRKRQKCFFFSSSCFLSSSSPEKRTAHMKGKEKLFFYAQFQSTESTFGLMRIEKNATPLTCFLFQTVCVFPPLGWPIWANLLPSFGARYNWKPFWFKTFVQSFIKFIASFMLSIFFEKFSTKL